METNLMKLSLISFLNFLIIGLIAPLILPRLIEIGASLAVTGIFDASYTGVVILAGPLIGSWSDLRGRKYVATLIFTIAAICYFLLGLTETLTAIFLLRTVLGMVEHTPIMVNAIIGDIIPKEKHSKAYSSNGVMMSLGIIIGPIIGGHLVEAKNGFFYVCTLAALAYVAIMGITQTFPQNQKHNVEETASINFTNEFLKIFVEFTKIDWKTFGDFLYLKFILSLSIMIYFKNQTMYLHEKYDLPQKSVGYVISFFGLMGIVGTLFIPYIRTRFYKNDKYSFKFLLHQFVIMTVSFFVLHIVTNLNIFVMTLVPLSLANVSLNLVITEVTVNKATDDVRGSLVGVSESVAGLGRFFAPLLSGIIASYLEESNIMFLALLSTLSAVAVCIKLLYQEKRSIKHK